MTLSGNPFPIDPTKLYVTSIYGGGLNITRQDILGSTILLINGLPYPNPYNIIIDTSTYADGINTQPGIVDNTSAEILAIINSPTGATAHPYDPTSISSINNAIAGFTTDFQNWVNSLGGSGALAGILSHPASYEPSPSQLSFQDIQAVIAEYQTTVGRLNTVETALQQSQASTQPTPQMIPPTQPTPSANQPAPGVLAPASNNWLIGLGLIAAALGVGALVLFSPKGKEKVRLETVHAQ